MTLIQGGRYRYKADNPEIIKEMEAIFAIKADLIKKIMVLRPDSDENSLGFKRPEDLQKILDDMDVVKE